MVSPNYFVLRALQTASIKTHQICAPTQCADKMLFTAIHSFIMLKLTLLIRKKNSCTNI